MVFFDRSWYNRAGVERVMGFCDSQEYLEFMRQVPDLERMLVRSGIRLFKYWFSVTHDEQQRRFLGNNDGSSILVILAVAERGDLGVFDLHGFACGYRLRRKLRMSGLGKT